MVKFQILWNDGRPYPEGFLKNKDRVLRQVYLALGLYWQGHFYHKHFTAAGAKEYGYTPRKGEGLSGKAFWRSYLGQKQRRQRHQLPLVWSGKSRALGAKGRVMASAKGVRITIPAPALNFRPPGSSVDMRREMETISNAEMAILNKVADVELEKQFSKLREVAAAKQVRDLRVFGQRLNRMESSLRRRATQARRSASRGGLQI